MKNIDLIRNMLIEVHNARNRAINAVYKRDLSGLDISCVEGITWFEGILAEIERQRKETEISTNANPG